MPRVAPRIAGRVNAAGARPCIAAAQSGSRSTPASRASACRRAPNQGRLTVVAPDLALSTTTRTIADGIANGLDPLVGARNVLDQVSAGRFYVSTHPVEVWERLTGAQNDDRLAGRAPRLQLFD